MRLPPAPARPIRTSLAVAVLLGLACGEGPTDPVPADSAPLLVLAAEENNVLAADLYLLSADGSARRRLTTLPQSQKQSARWSPDGRLIAFVREDPTGGLYSGAGDVWLVAPDGSGLRQLTRTGNVRAVRWVGADRVAARVQGGATLGWTGVTVADGATFALALPAALLSATSLEWSDDGTRLAYRDASGAITVAAADGTGPRTVAAGQAARWVRGSARLVLSAPRPDAAGGRVLLADANGAGVTVVADDSTTASLSLVAAAPGADRVAYVSSRTVGGIPTLRAYVRQVGAEARPAYTGAPLAGRSWYEIELDWRPAAR